MNYLALNFAGYRDYVGYSFSATRHVYTVSKKKISQNVFVMFFTKLGRF